MKFTRSSCIVTETTDGGTKILRENEACKIYFVEIPTKTHFNIAPSRDSDVYSGETYIKHGMTIAKYHEMMRCKKSIVTAGESFSRKYATK